VPLSQNSPSKISQPLLATKQPSLPSAANSLLPPRGLYSKPFAIETDRANPSIHEVIEGSSLITPAASSKNLLIEDGFSTQNFMGSGMISTNKKVISKVNMYSSPVNLRGINDNFAPGINSAGVGGSTLAFLGSGDLYSKKHCATDERVKHQAIRSDHRASFNDTLGTHSGNSFVYRFEDHGLISKVNSTVTAKPTLDAYEIREFQKVLDLQPRVPEHVFEEVMGDTALTRISKVYFCLKMEVAIFF
jgi:hypothetical protein